LQREEQALVIEAKVKKRLGDFLLDAELKDEGFVCLWGPNGAGKTTLLNVLAGILAPDDGFVRVNAEDVTTAPLEKRGIVLIKQDSCLPHLNVEDHLSWGARAKGLRVDDAYVEGVKKALGVTFSGKVGNLSLGMREKVSLATALISRPKVILVDEVFFSLSGRAEFMDAYRGLGHTAGADVIFTSQTGELEPESTDHSYRMEAGRATRLF
jgi:molybdate/tungstate transport system ATP-binding protein